MKHPFATTRKNLLIYLSAWLIHALLSIVFWHGFYKLPFSDAIPDAIFHSFWFGILALGLWFAVRYSKVESNSTFNLLVNHLAALSITLVIWLTLGYYSVINLPFIDLTYNTFYKDSIDIRLISGVMQYLFIIMMYYTIMYYSDFRDKALQTAVLENDKQKAELNLLRFQLNPHFLFNSLNSITAYTHTDADKARNMIILLSDYLRFSLQHKDEKWSSLAKEMENLWRYLQLEKIRFGNRLEITENIGEESKSKKIPSLILQPLIENAIKHGLQSDQGNVNVQIGASFFHGYLKVWICNPFDGASRKPVGTGTGLDNVKDRMALIYQRNDLVRVEADRKMFKVELNFPCDKNY
ncbi:MAG: histidine kinase [Cyclobacteriaceae bacterium]|nr:histidine kinase [Cyclobacteriaceae bacterium]